MQSSWLLLVVLLSLEVCEGQHACFELGWVRPSVL
jgi:hypothetical protein